MNTGPVGGAQSYREQAEDVFVPNFSEYISRHKTREETEEELELVREGRVYVWHCRRTGRERGREAKGG